MDTDNPNYAKIMGYVDRNPAAVLSTIGDNGPHGAAIYVVTASHGTLCFVTKSKTQKYANLIKHPVVGLTFFNEKEGTTLQVTGRAYAAPNTELKDYVLEKMRKAHAIMADWLPPVAKLPDGEYVVIGVELAYARLTEFGGLDIGDPVFTEFRKNV